MDIRIVEKVLGANDSIAAENRAFFDAHDIVAINIMGSPGAGKTSLLERTVEALRGRCSVAVIEGDIATSYDAERIARLDVSVVQIATGGECHLDAAMVKMGISSLDLADIDILAIENVGNLVCPAEYDLGEHKKIVVTSFPEGDDKVEKYPLMFRLADAVVLNKLDLAAGVEFDVEQFGNRLRSLNPAAAMFAVSCRSADGIEQWADWICGLRPKAVREIP